MTAYYNEIDPKAVAWLRELIKQGHIADGIVDDRSITDVTPNDLKEYTQCHFFAGIGVWSYALRQAGWSDDRPIWSASCPCQPFSSAGQGKGVEDERHLFPVLSKLIQVRKPIIIIGEQVSGKAGLTWFDDVQSEMEKNGYATGSVTFPACSVGSPHLRQRQYWMAERMEQDAPCLGWRGGSDGDTAGESRALQTQGLCASGGLSDNNSNGCEAGREVRPLCKESDIEHGGTVSGLPDTSGQGSQMHSGHGNGGDQSGRQPSQPTRLIADGDISDRMDDASGIRGQDIDRELLQTEKGQEDTTGNVGTGETKPTTGHPRPTNGLWRNADWLYCRDGKWRPVEPGTFPLAHGAAERVGRLRGYGNAIVAEQAKIFIETAMEIL